MSNRSPVPLERSSSAELAPGSARRAWKALAGCPQLSGASAPPSVRREWTWTAQPLDVDDEHREVNFAVRARATDDRSYLTAELRAAIEERGGMPSLRLDLQSRATGAIGHEQASSAVLEAVTAELRRTVAGAAAAAIPIPASVPEGAATADSRDRERVAMRVLVALLAVLVLFDRYLDRRSARAGDRRNPTRPR